MCNNVNNEHTAHQARVLGLYAQDLLHDHYGRHDHYGHHGYRVWLSLRSPCLADHLFRPHMMRLALFQVQPKVPKNIKSGQISTKKRKPFVAFRKQPNLSLPSTARKPFRQPGTFGGKKKSQNVGTPEKQYIGGPRQEGGLARQPKQRDPEEDEEEPVAEPEPSSHHKGDPRTHAFHSCNTSAVSSPL